jgi:putative transposase
MPRPTRLCVAGQTHHVIQRGNNKQPIFFAAADRQFFLQWLAEGLTREDCALHAYVLMTNHVHLLLTTGRDDSLPRLMQSLGRRYVGYVNRRYERTGTLWEGRYRATVLDSDTYVLACYRYIEANPVRAGIVRRAQDYPWSSYRSNALGRADALLKPHATYAALGATPAARQAAYCTLCAQGVADDVVETLRDATQRGWVPGGQRFRNRIEAALGRPAGPPRRGRPPMQRQRAEEKGSESFIALERRDHLARSEPRDK